MRKKVLLAQQVKALARLEHEIANFERRTKKSWPRIISIAREAKERTKSELSIGEILMLYGIVSVLSWCGSSGIGSISMYA